MQKLTHCVLDRCSWHGSIAERTQACCNLAGFPDDAVQATKLAELHEDGHGDPLHGAISLLKLCKSASLTTLATAVQMQRYIEVRWQAVVVVDAATAQERHEGLA